MMVLGEAPIAVVAISEVESETYVAAVTESVTVEGDMPSHTNAQSWWVEVEYHA